MAKITKIKSGEVFKSHNKYMNPPKEKYHLCINDTMYFIINTKAHSFNCEISPKDCSILKYNCYIDCGTIRIEPIKEFIVIEKEQLSTEAILRLIEKLKCTPTLTTIQRENVVTILQSCIEKRNIS